MLVSSGEDNLARLSAEREATRSATASPATATGAAAERALALAWYASALLAVGLAGLLRLEVPLDSDQALFLFYARRLHDGARLYVDFWDVKAPAIFAFYGAAGNLFGFTDVGVHLLEVLWMAALAVVLMLGLRPYLRQKWSAAAAPIAVVGVFYALCSQEAQTQVEALVNLPMLLCVLALARAAETPSRRSGYAVLAGVAAAVVTTFKVVFAPIFIAMVLVTSVVVLQAEGRRFGGPVLLRLWLPFSLGVAAVWLLVLTAFVAEGTAAAMLWTIFGFPFEALAGIVYAPIKRLLVGLRMFIGAYAPWLVFVALALAVSWRRGVPPIFWLMATWLIAGFFVIVMQRTAWWFYHFMLLLTPMGVFATFGIDRAVTFLRQRAALSPVRAMAVGCLLVLPAAGSLVGPLAETANWLYPALVSKTKPMADFKNKFQDYAEVSAAAAFVRAQSTPGPVMVFETPLINLLSGRAHATPIHGFNWAWILPRQREETLDALKASPPPFVFVGTKYDDRLERPNTGVPEFLASRYRVAWHSPFGRWYARKDLDID